MARTWDIFCSVIDNFGDIGICWRLARQLSSELGQSVRLWVDDLASFHRLCRAVDPALTAQFIDAVEVRRWRATLPQVEPADIVIEGFGVPLPAAYVEAMAARLRQPVWINLEYLSAESWIDGCHGLPSPHPSLPLVKHFFFPGFTPASGGLLIERGLAQARAAFQSDPAAMAVFWQALGLASLDPGALRVSLFCYDNGALPALAEEWRSEPLPVVCIVPEGAALAQLSRSADRRIEPGSCLKLGGLTIAAIPFLDLEHYDRLLWACDVNFVRGEDSFLRAQLAARPMVWQAYPQEESAHLRKTEAFLERYTSGLDSGVGADFCAFTQAWNRESTDMGGHWAALRSHFNVLSTHARCWAGKLAASASLANKLAEFCEDRLK